MIILLAILAATRASPLSSPSAPVISLAHRQAPSCDDPDGCRSLGDIIRSCALTIFLCTWVSVHPNIPSPHEGWPRIALRRAGIMLAALIFPEAIIAWALRQRFEARRLAKEHKREGWTITHGFFASMGGFMLYEGNRPIRVLFPYQLASYSLTGNGDFPRISKTEIDDKSKGDAISKGVVILQTGWFVVQCIARAAQGLPVTELELITVAFAALNFVIYVLWWEKPLNVQRGVRVYEKRRTAEPLYDGDVEATVGFWGALRDGIFYLPTAIVRGPLEDYDFRFSWLSRIALWPIIQSLDIITGEMSHDFTGLRVTTFYPYFKFEERPLGFLVVTVVASAFGGIHCIGWLFTFPSSAERTLWQVASVLITSVPIAVSLLTFTSSVPISESDVDFITIIVTSLSFFYALGRLVLLVLSFLCLRSLPPAAYHVVHWTSFIPHV